MGWGGSMGPVHLEKTRNCCPGNIVEVVHKGYQQCPMTVFSDFRRCADALERLAASQTRQISSAEEGRIAADRLNQLELDRAQFESDCEGLLMKAEGKLKAAANAEARERTMRKSHEEDIFADSGPDGDEIAPRLPAGDVAAVEESEVFPVPVALALNDKAYATRAKFS